MFRRLCFLLAVFIGESSLGQNVVPNYVDINEYRYTPMSNPDGKHYAFAGPTSTGCRGGKIEGAVSIRGTMYLVRSSSSFDNCTNLSSIIFPQNITYLGHFFNCYSLKTIDIPEKVTAIGQTAFLNCYHLKSVSIPAGLATIGEQAFRNCELLKSIDLSGCKVSKIEKWTFRNCVRLQTAHLPESLRQIVEMAFLDSGLDSIVIPRRVYHVGAQAFQGCKSLKKVTFTQDNEKISIRDYVFDGCRSLGEIVLPPTLIYIGKYAFRNCISLAGADIPEGSQRIENNAFENCLSLRRVVIPSTTESVGDSAFCGCTALDTLYALMDTPCETGRDAFASFSDHCVLMVPIGRTHAYRAAGWSEEVFRGGIREIGAPAGVSTIKVKPQDTKYYDLEGRPVTRPEKGRIYIHDGRKVVK